MVTELLCELEPHEGVSTEETEITPTHFDETGRELLMNELSDHDDDEENEEFGDEDFDDDFDDDFEEELEDEYDFEDDFGDDGFGGNEDKELDLTDEEE